MGGSSGKGEPAVTAFARPTQQLRSLQSLRRLVQAAETVLRREGLEGLTMPAVAREAGVSIGGIYRRFENKEALLLAIHDAMVTRIEQAVADRMAAATCLWEVVAGLAQAHAELLGADEALFGTLLSSGRVFPRQRQRAQRGVDQNISAFVETALRHGDDIRASDPRLALTFAFHLMFSSIMSRVMRPGAPSFFPAMTWPVLGGEAAKAAYAYLTSSNGAPDAAVATSVTSPRAKRGA